jgi:hypothetical protein
MCFTIDRKAPRWRNRYVWKMLERVDNGNFDSPYFRGPYWPRNSTVVAQGRARTQCSGLRAAAGIYVYRTRRLAQDSLRSSRRAVIVRLRVSPRDFLYTNGAIATYRKVRTGRFPK